MATLPMQGRRRVFQFLPVIAAFMPAAPQIDGAGAIAPICSAPTSSFAPLQRTARAQAPAIWLVARTPRTQSQQVVLPVADGKPLEIWRADDGLFYVDGAVNGRPVRFLIDTGASMIVLTSDDARRVGAGNDGPAEMLHADTANGKSTMAKVTLQSMQVGGTGAAAVPAAVAPQGLRVSLLGQNWLSHLASVTIAGDRMILR